jgi:hypothetical protein
MVGLRFQHSLDMVRSGQYNIIHFLYAQCLTTAVLAVESGRDWSLVYASFVKPAATHVQSFA